MIPEGSHRLHDADEKQNSIQRAINTLLICYSALLVLHVRSSPHPPPFFLSLQVGNQQLVVLMSEFMGQSVDPSVLVEMEDDLSLSQSQSQSQR